MLREVKALTRASKKKEKEGEKEFEIFCKSEERTNECDPEGGCYEFYEINGRGSLDFRLFFRARKFTSSIPGTKGSLNVPTGSVRLSIPGILTISRISTGEGYYKYLLSFDAIKPCY